MEHEIQSLVREHAPLVWRVLLHLGVPESHLDDLSQEVLLTVWRKLPDFRGQSNIRTWIYGICRNVAADARRSAVARREIPVAQLPETVVQPAQEGSLWVKQAHAQLILALDGLDEEQRMVFVLFEIEQLEMQEISDALQTPLTTCYSRLTAARGKVMAQLRRQARPGATVKEGTS